MAVVFRTRETGNRETSALFVEGELDLSVVSQFAAVLQTAVARARGGVCVDLSRVTYLDSSSMHTLVNAAVRAHADGKHFRISNAHGVARQVLEITGVDDLVGLMPEN